MHLRSILSSKKKKKKTKQIFLKRVCILKYIVQIFQIFLDYRQIGILCFSFFEIENLRRYPINLKIVCKLYMHDKLKEEKKTNWIIVTRKLQKKSVLYICMVCFNNVLIIAQRINKTKNEIKKNNMSRLIFSRIKNLKL